jgi:hypothetical protein
MTVKVKFAFLLLAAGISASGPARAADPMAARLSAERVGGIAAGTYAADAADGAGGRQFLLEPYGDKYLLRFLGEQEIFVLTVDRASLGARLLKYDTGATALRVSVWGALTLYTYDAPGGVPASRQGDAPIPSLTPVSAPDLNAAMQDESKHLRYSQNINLHFLADPGVMADDGEARAVAFDTLTNTVRGIERFLVQPAARKALTPRIDSVRLAEGAKPTVLIAGHSLMVSFVPDEGYEGRASSHAIAHALGKLFQVQTPE